LFWKKGRRPRRVRKKEETSRFPEEENLGSAKGTMLHQRNLSITRGGGEKKRLKRCARDSDFRRKWKKVRRG